MTVPAIWSDRIKHDDGRIRFGLYGQRLGRRQSVSQMDDHANELRAARNRVEQLVQVIVEIGSDLDLDGTLHRIVEAAMTLTGARIGALGIRGADGSPVTFVHTGIDGDTLTLHYSDADLLADELAGFGPEVLVLGPESLRGAVRDRLLRTEADHG